MCEPRTGCLAAGPPPSASHGRRGTAPSPAPDRRAQASPAAAPRPDGSRPRPGQRRTDPRESAALFRARLPSCVDATAEATRSFRTCCRHPEDQPYRASQTPPAGGLEFELRLAFPSEAVELRVAARLGFRPLGGKQTAIFEPMERGIQRT